MPDRYSRFAVAYKRFRNLSFAAAATDFSNQTHLEVCQHLGPEVHTRPLEQMLLISNILHERGGANRSYPAHHREALGKALREEDVTFEEAVLGQGDFAEQVWSEFLAACRKHNHEPNERCTKGPVKQTIELLHSHGTANWVDLLRQLGSPVEAWNELTGLKGVGHKLASFTLREFQELCSVWPDLAPDVWYCFMPLDRWVLRASRYIWGEENITLNVEGVKRYRTRATFIASHFDTLDEAMEFDMGAWFLNANRAQILGLNGFFDMDLLNEDWLLNNAANLEPNSVILGLNHTATEYDHLD